MPRHTCKRTIRNRAKRLVWPMQLCEFVENAWKETGAFWCVQRRLIWTGLVVLHYMCLTRESRRMLQAEALHHYGVAAASCAQVKGLGMMERAAASAIPPAAEIFVAGETALQEAISIREGMGHGAADLLLAQSIAAQAELYYCAASANTQLAVRTDDRPSGHHLLGSTCFQWLLVLVALPLQCKTCWTRG